MAFSILRLMAVLLARASMQPRAPQPQRGPPALMIMCPSSPALPVDPFTICPVEDQAAADPGPDERRDDLAKSTPGTQPKFGIAAHANVVPHQDGPFERRRELRPDRVILHVQVGTENDNARVRRPAGRANRCPPTLISPRDRPASAIASSTQSTIALRIAGPPSLAGVDRLARPENPVVGVDHAAQYLGSSQIDSDNRSFHRPARS